MLSLDPNMDRLRLFKFGGTDVGTPYMADLNPGVEYQVKVEADGSDFKVYLNGILAITAHDATYTQGSVGLHV